MGYLGKISAVVAVNTGDFSSKLNRCAGDVKSFASATERSINAASRAAAKSLGSIYTDVQKLERALKAAQDPKLNFKGIKGFDGKTLGEAVAQMQRIASVAAQISDPLAAAAKKSETLSMAIRGGIHAALVATQGRAEELQSAIAGGATVGRKKFVEMAEAVRMTAQAMERVAEADAMIGRLSGGRNMRSQSPQAYAALSRSGAVEGSVEKLPAGAIADTQGLLARQRAAAANVGIAYSKLEAKKAQGLDTTGAQANLDKRVAKLNYINDLIEQEIGLHQKAKAAEEAKASAAEKLLKLQQGFTLSMSGQVQSVSQLRSAYDSLIARAEKLTDAQRSSLASGGFSANAATVMGVISEGDESKVGGASSAMASMEAAVSGFEDLNDKAKAAKKSADDLRESLARIADSIGQPAAPIDQATQAIDRMNSAIAKIKDPAQKAKAEQYAAGIRKDIEAEVALSGATGNAPAGSVMSGAAKRANKLADAADAINNAPAPPKKKTMDDIFGPVVGSRANQIDQLKTKIVSIHSEMEKLPVPLQMSLRPQLEKIRLLFENLGPKSTRKEIEDAAREAKLFGDQVQRTAQAQKFGGTFGEFLDDTSAKKYEAELAAVQSKMAEIGATAGGPVAQAINKYRTELAKASEAGILGQDDVRAKMKENLADVEKATVEEKLLTKAQAKGVFGGIRRAGDISRMGADKVGLALNQAAFAIDDFMSSTGGIEMKIRAVSNNLSQLGFVLGGTAGLFAALGVTIVSQAGIAIYKFINGGKSAADQSKALNEALDKQRSLVEELATAYGGLSKEIALSAAASNGMQAAGSLAAVGKANSDFRTGRLTAVSQGVVDAKADSAGIKRSMESVTTVGVALAKESRLRLASAKEFIATSEARAAKARTPEEIDALRSQRRSLSNRINSNFAGRAFEAVGLEASWSSRVKAMAKELEAVELALRGGEDAIVEAANNIAYETAAASHKGRMQIEQAQSQLADAIAAGVPGANGLQAELDDISFAMSNAAQRLAESANYTNPNDRKQVAEAASKQMADAMAAAAQASKRAVEMRIKAMFSGPTAAQSLQEAASNPRLGNVRPLAAGIVVRSEAERQAAVDLASSNLATQRAEAERIRAEGSARYARTFDAFSEALENVREMDRNPRQYSDQQRGEAEATLERARAAVAREEQTVNRANDEAEARVKAAEAAREAALAENEAAKASERLAASALRAAQAIDESLGRTRKIGEGALSVSEQIADMRQKDYTERPTEENKKKRDQAEDQLRIDRERERYLQAELTQSQQEAFMDPVVLRQQMLADSYREAVAEEQAAAAREGRMADPLLLREYESFTATVDMVRNARVAELTAPQQAAMDAFAQEKEAQRQVAEMDIRSREFRAAERARVRQGREDAMTVRERQRLEAERGAENMAAAAATFTNPAERQAFVQKYYDNKKNELLKEGPLGEYANERTNAMFSGARRLGLEASDVTTSEGQRELNRLLRGDDANKDVNFAEMQKQSEILSDIRDAVRANTGMTIDIP